MSLSIPSIVKNTRTNSMEEGHACVSRESNTEKVRKYVHKKGSDPSRVLDLRTNFHSRCFNTTSSVAMTLATEKMLSQQNEMSFSVTNTLLHLEAIKRHAPATS